MVKPTINIQPFKHVNWQPHAGGTYITENGNTDIWRIRVSEHISAINNLWQLLNAGEHQRANRYYREKDKQRFIVSRWALRLLLGKYLHVNPEEIIFETGRNQKPHIKHHTNLHYNVSHSGDYVLIAISGSEVGVDVEHTDTNLHYQDIMQIAYSDEEIDVVNRSADPLSSFYIFWTRKEALLKATAKGIDDEMKLIPALDGSYAPFPSMNELLNNWFVSSFVVREGYIGTVSSSTGKCGFWIIGAK